MKWKPNRNSISIGFTAFFVIAASMLFYFLLFRTKTLGIGLSKLVSVLNPIIYGYITAYILNPILCLNENIIYWFFKKINKKPTKRTAKFVRVLCTLLAVSFAIFLVYLLGSIILPELAKSIQSITVNFQRYVNNVTNFLDTTLLKNNEELDAKTTSLIVEYAGKLEEWLTNEIKPAINGMLSYLTNGIFDIITVMKNLLLGLVISMYVLISKEALLARCRRVIYSFWSIPNANRIVYNLRFADEKFGGFLIGKIVDSGIIGVVTYIACIVFRFPYGLLIAVFIGVTNVIPFFGPFIGAVPATILIFVVDPFKALWFIVFILILQQIDGNLLGPRILGSSVGVSSYMVVVSILIGAGFFGVTGMIVAVPSSAILVAFVQTQVLKMSRKRNLPSDLESYHYLDKIDPDTHELINFVDTDEKSSFMEWMRSKSASARDYDLPLKGYPWDRTIEQIEQEEIILGLKKNSTPVKSKRAQILDNSDAQDDGTT